MKCVGALLVRNEADRYLLRALDNAAQFCDEIVVVDDASTDATAEICEAHPKVTEVIRRNGEGWWNRLGSESPARQLLWETAVHRAGPGGWIYLFDADHELLGITPEEFRHLLRSQTVNAWACVLWDTWDNENLQRVDSYWVAWRVPRPWLLKAQPHPDFKPEWNGRTIHVGHAPPQYPMIPGLMPPDAGIRHLGYVAKADRLRKWQRYTNLGTTTNQEPNADGQTDSR